MAVFLIPTTSVAYLYPLFLFYKLTKNSQKSYYSVKTFISYSNFGKDFKKQFFYFEIVKQYIKLLLTLYANFMFDYYFTKGLLMLITLFIYSSIVS